MCTPFFGNKPASCRLASEIRRTRAVTTRSGRSAQPAICQPSPIETTAMTPSARPDSTRSVCSCAAGSRASCGGVAASAGVPFRLDDGSVLTIDTAFILGPRGEIIDGVGVPADQTAPPPTAAELSGATTRPSP
jgi:hypothetical protein